MKRLALLLAITTLFVAVSATSAMAATIKVRTSATGHTVSGRTHVDFRVSLSRAARVKIDIYRGGTKIRTIAPRTYARTIATSWNLKNGAGAYVRPGTYTYVVTATYRTSTGRARGYRNVASSWVPASARVDRFFGAYVKGAPDSMQPVADLETRVAANAEIVNFYVALTEGFPRDRVDAIRSHNAKPLVTLEFWDYRRGVNQPEWNLASISSGAHDAQIRAFARDAKEYGQPMWVRPLHEMNSNWYPWGGTVNGNSPDDYAPAFRHIVEIFRSEGATNVSFVWCPNNESVPNTAANGIAAYFPGDAYVDVVGLDGYNFGSSFSWSSWRSFSDLFTGSYATVTRLSTRPVVICETGCSTAGGNKSAWLAQMFSALSTSFPRVTGVVWFNTHAECDWRIESDTAALSVFRASVATF